MTEPDGRAEIIEVETDVLERLSEGQYLLHEEFERLAAAVQPLLAKQYHDTQLRVRALETRVRNRQERPLIIRMARLLADVRRLESGADVKVHVEEAVVEALASVGYEETGAPGEPYDPDRHEPLSGSLGTAGIVTRVHSRGLECYGDVIIKARVDVEPAAAADGEQARDDTEQGETPT